MIQKHYHRVISWVLFFCFVLFNACNYYIPQSKTLTSDKTQNEALIKSFSNKTVIIHSGGDYFLLKDLKIGMDKEEISGVLSGVPLEHQVYLKDDKQKFNYSSTETAVLNEVHLYTSAYSKDDMGKSIVLPVKEIYKIEVIERDRAKSSSTTLLTAAGVTIGALALVAVIVALTKSSCPFISVYDGENYVLQGESFGGAIYPSLAREDYMPLPAAAVGKEIKLQISNELKERQYTDMADLIVVQHESNQKVLIDPEGKMYQVKRSYEPKEAFLNNSLNMLPALQSVDNLVCSFGDIHHNSSINQLKVNFERPTKDSSLGLILDLRNSYWLDYLFDEFSSKFGKRFANWREVQNKRPAEDLLKWIEDQKIPLTVMAKTVNGWEEVYQLKTIGPLMNRELAIPLEGLEFPETGVEIAFQTGFMFWELDKVNLAEIVPVTKSQTHVLKPVNAIDENGQNMLPPLLEMDGIYLEQLEIGNRAYLSYAFDQYEEGKNYSVFLKSKGYYEPIREFEGPANKKYLAKFKQSGFFSDFSLKNYLDITQTAGAGR